MLESEMKKKICPMMSRFGEKQACQGSKCAVWEERTRYGERPKDEDGNPMYGRGVVVPMVPMDPPEGYCGLMPPEMNCNYG